MINIVNLLYKLNWLVSDCMGGQPLVVSWNQWVEAGYYTEIGYVFLFNYLLIHH